MYVTENFAGVSENQKQEKESEDNIKRLPNAES
jgi:hypothetical protein